MSNNVVSAQEGLVKDHHYQYHQNRAGHHYRHHHYHHHHQKYQVGCAEAKYACVFNSLFCKRKMDLHLTVSSNHRSIR